MIHGYDDIPLFMSFFNIPVSLDDLVQRIAPVDDRFDLSCLKQFFKEDKIINLQVPRCVIDIKVGSCLFKAFFACKGESFPTASKSISYVALLGKNPPVCNLLRYPHPMLSPFLNLLHRKPL